MFGYTISAELTGLKYNNEHFNNQGVYTFSWMMQGGQMSLYASAGDAELSVAAVKGSWTRYYLVYEMPEGKTSDDVTFTLEFSGEAALLASGTKEYPWGYVDAIQLEYGNTAPVVEEEDFINYVVDGSFENQQADTALAAPWTSAGTYDPAHVLAVGNAGNANTGSMYAGYWGNTATEDFTVEQMITDIPANMYTLRVFVMNGDSVKPANAYLYIKDYGGNERKVNIDTKGFNAGYTEYKITDIEITSGTATVGVRVNVGSTAKYWINIDDFALYQEGEYTGYDLIGLTNAVAAEEAGFETADLAGAGVAAAGAGSAELSTEQARSGEKSVKITGDDADLALTRTISGLTPGGYVMSVYAMGAGPVLSLTANGVTAESTLADAAGFKQYTVQFTVGDEGTAAISLRVIGSGATEVYLDDLFVGNNDLRIEAADVELYQGKTANAVVKFYPSAKTEAVTYAGYDAAIISVSAKGRISALAEGTTTVTVTSASGASCTFTVTVSDNTLTAFTTGDFTMYLGETTRTSAIRFTLTPAVATLGEVSFAVKSGESVTLTDGVLTGVATGETVITATDSVTGLTTDFTVTVLGTAEILDAFNAANTLTSGTLDGLGWKVTNTLLLGADPAGTPSIGDGGLSLWLNNGAITGTFVISREIHGLAAGDYKLGYAISGTVPVTAELAEGTEAITLDNKIFTKTTGETTPLKLTFTFDYTAAGANAWGSFLNVTVNPYVELTGIAKFNDENAFAGTTKQADLEALGWTVENNLVLSGATPDPDMTSLWLHSTAAVTGEYVMTYRMTGIEAGNYVFSYKSTAVRINIKAEGNGVVVSDSAATGTVTSEAITVGADGVLELKITLTYTAVNAYNGWNSLTIVKQ